MRELFPEFNQEEAFVTDRLSPAECTELAVSLREIVKQLEEKGEERRQAAVTRGAEPYRRRLRGDSGDFYVFWSRTIEGRP